MLHVALWEPEIPPNTGNVARLCAATNSPLHLIGRIGFRLDEKSLQRAGLDYWPWVKLVFHPTFDDFEKTLSPDKIVCIETPAPQTYLQFPFEEGQCLLFGSESKGLPESIRKRYANKMLSIPILNPQVRSLNLANSVGIVLFHALAKLGSI